MFFACWRISFNSFFIAGMLAMNYCTYSLSDNMFISYYISKGLIYSRNTFHWMWNFGLAVIFFHLCQGPPSAETYPQICAGLCPLSTFRDVPPISAQGLNPGSPSLRKDTLFSHWCIASCLSTPPTREIVTISCDCYNSNNHWVIKNRNVTVASMFMHWFIISGTRS